MLGTELMMSDDYFKVFLLLFMVLFAFLRSDSQQVAKTLHNSWGFLYSLWHCCVSVQKKKKISDVTVMQFCQVPVFNFYSVGHRCFLSISSPLSNVGSRRWILNLSGWDPGTHTHTQKKKLFTFMSRNKETRNKHPRMCQCCRCTHQTFKGFSCRSSVCPVVILKGVTLSELYI